MTEKLAKTVGCKVDEETYVVLKRYADLDDRTVSYIIRKIIDEFVEKKGLKKTPVRKKRKG